MKKLLLVPLLVHCASMNPPADPEVDPNYIYKMDMDLQINNRVGNGVVVAPRSPKYNLKLKAAGKLDLFTFTNCHREMAQASETRDIVLDYTPISRKELSGTCPIQLGGYEKERGRHSWGFIDFEDPGYTMVADLKCNGVASLVNGVGACQSLTGLIQEITFSVPVIISPEEKCPMPVSKDKKTFEFPIITGQCVYIFMDATKGSDRLLRLTTIGYEKILFRDK